MVLKRYRSKSLQTGEGTSVTLRWGNIDGQLSDQLDLQSALTNKVSVPVFNNHVDDTNIHYTQGDININESQISDLDKYSQSSVDSMLNDKADQSAFDTHTGDSSIHYSINQISISHSQIHDFDPNNYLQEVNWGDVGGNITDQSDLQNALDSKASQSDFDDHTTNQNNPHSTSLSSLSDTDVGDAQENQFLKRGVDEWTSSDLDAGDIQTGSFSDERIAQSNVTQHQGAIDHDQLNNFESDRHARLNDLATNTTELWSSQKISGEISNVGSKFDQTASGTGEIEGSSGTFSPGFEPDHVFIYFTSDPGGEWWINAGEEDITINVANGNSGATYKWFAVTFNV